MVEVEWITEPVLMALARIEAKMRDPATALRALVPATEPTLFAAQENAPVHEGFLTANIRQEIVGPSAIAIRTDLPYSWMRERGGTIKPVRAQALHWFDYEGGKHFSQHVEQTGDFYMERAYEATRASIPPLFLANYMAELS